MNQEYLEALLSRARNLKSFDKDEGEDLKIKTIEAFKVLFANDLERNFQLKEMRFSYSPVENTSFRETKNQLVSILESKIDVLQYGTRQSPLVYPNKFIPKSNIAVGEAYEKRLTSANEVVSKSEIIIDTLQSEIRTLKSRVRFEKKLRVFKDISIGCVFLAGAFSFGYYFGNNRFDNEKINLSEKVKVQEILIDSIEKSRKNPK